MSYLMRGSIRFLPSLLFCQLTQNTPDKKWGPRPRRGSRRDPRPPPFPPRARSHLGNCEARRPPVSLCAWDGSWRSTCARAGGKSIAENDPNTIYAPSALIIHEDATVCLLTTTTKNISPCHSNPPRSLFTVITVHVVRRPDWNSGQSVWSRNESWLASHGGTSIHSDSSVKRMRLTLEFVYRLARNRPF